MRPLTLNHPFNAHAETAQHKRILGIILESIKMEVSSGKGASASGAHQHGLPMTVLLLCHSSTGGTLAAQMRHTHLALKCTAAHLGYVCGASVFLRSCRPHRPWRCRAMQDECNALELELKHHEKEFAELVSEELEQRFMRFEEVTLAAVQKAIGIINAPAAGATANRPLLHHSVAICKSAKSVSLWL